LYDITYLKFRLVLIDYLKTDYEVVWLCKIGYEADWLCINWPLQISHNRPFTDQLYNMCNLFDVYRLIIACIKLTVY